MALTLEQTTLDTTMAAIGSKATYTGATATTFSWMLSSEFGIAVGMFIGCLGFALNWYYSRKRDRREQDIHDVVMMEHRKAKDASHGI